MLNVLTEEETREGYRLLFDGKSLNGWAATQFPDGWAVEEGTIICTVKGDGYLHTVDRYEDFLLRIDFKTEPNVNSGIFIRWTDLSDPVNTGLEMQILDTYHKQTVGNHDCGAVYELVAPSTNAVRPAGEWNHAEIICQGSKIQITLNDTPIINMDIDQWSVPGKNPDGTPNKFTYAWKDLSRSGYIGLQDHGGRVLFRNIKLLPL